MRIRGMVGEQVGGRRELHPGVGERGRHCGKVLSDEAARYRVDRQVSVLTGLEQPAELDLRLDLGLAGLAEPELAAGQRVLAGAHPGTPRPARQSLYVTGRT